MRLGKICTIQTGYTARTRLESGDEGIPVIQLKDVPTEGVIQSDNRIRMNLPETTDRYQVGAGDLVFRSRGERTTACMLSMDFEGFAVAVLPLVIIRPKPELVIPEYLTWAINQPDAQRQLEADAQGTNLRMIPRASLDRLKIGLPDLQTQKGIAKIDGLARREKTLSIKLAQARAGLLARVLHDKAKQTCSISANKGHRA